MLFRATRTHIGPDDRKALMKHKSETSSGWWSERYFPLGLLVFFGFLFLLFSWSECFSLSRSRNQFILILFNVSKLCMNCPIWVVLWFAGEIGGDKKVIRRGEAWTTGTTQFAVVISEAFAISLMCKMFVYYCAAHKTRVASPGGTYSWELSR